VLARAEANDLIRSQRIEDCPDSRSRLGRAARLSFEASVHAQEYDSSRCQRP